MSDVLTLQKSNSLASNRRLGGAMGIEAEEPQSWPVGAEEYLTEVYSSPCDLRTTVQVESNAKIPIAKSLFIISP